jgi:hypothetical protein
VINPFDTYLVEDSDFNEQDRMREIQRLFRRQKAIESLLDSTLPPDVLLDMLEEQGLDAADYVEEIADFFQL